MVTDLLYKFRIICKHIDNILNMYMHIKKICSIFIYEKTFCSTVKTKTLWSYLYKNSFGNIKNFSKSETKIAKHVFCRINTK